MAGDNNGQQQQQQQQQITGSEAQRRAEIDKKRRKKTANNNTTLRDQQAAHLFQHPLAGPALRAMTGLTDRQRVSIEQAKNYETEHLAGALAVQYLFDVLFGLLIPVNFIAHYVRLGDVENRFSEAGSFAIDMYKASRSELFGSLPGYDYVGHDEESEQNLDKGSKKDVENAHIGARAPVLQNHHPVRVRPNNVPANPVHHQGQNIVRRVGRPRHN